MHVIVSVIEQFAILFGICEYTVAQICVKQKVLSLYILDYNFLLSAYQWR